MRAFHSGITRPLALALAALSLAVACHGPRHHRANMTEAELVEHMEEMAEFGLDHVDASDAQVARVGEVIRGLAPDLIKLRAEHRALARELRAEISKDTLDRARIEELRTRALDLFDRASTRGSEALLASLETLTPEQRRALVQKWEKHAH